MREGTTKIHRVADQGGLGGLTLRAFLVVRFEISRDLPFRGP